MQEFDSHLGGKIKAFVDGVQFEDAAKAQVFNIASLPFIHEHVAIMPDVHAGIGATVGSVIPTKGAIIPAAVGVDIGCGMIAVRTSLTASELPDSLYNLRMRIEASFPHGNACWNTGAWNNGIPNSVMTAWRQLEPGFTKLIQKTPHLEKANSLVALGSLGNGNHFFELCLDEEQRVWVMLHSGSRGIGNAIGRFYIEKARKMLIRREGGSSIPDKDLAWFAEGEPEFDEYIEAVSWAQDFARINREVMLKRALDVMRDMLPSFQMDKHAVNCHHNYVAKENHFGEDVFVTRKGAVKAGLGDLGIIPGSMGARSFIVRGKGNPDSFCSCSHGAGRMMSRTQAKKTFTLEDHIAATQGVECRKDVDVIDETPMAYKNIDLVMAAQADLVDIVHTLKQVLCIKG